MKRRTHLQYLWGGTVALTTNPLEIWSSVQTNQSPTSDCFSLLETLADLIIDLPEASAVELNEWTNFVDCYATGYVPKKEKNAFYEGCKEFKQFNEIQHKVPFEKIERKTQHNLLEKLFEGKLESKLPSGEKWIKQFRSYLMFAFYTSQRGASNQLAYLPIPGKYIGEISLKPNQKAWTL